ncbi:MAG: S8 family serine peptidase [Gemmatimonadales bacterium]
MTARVGVLLVLAACAGARSTPSRTGAPAPTPAPTAPRDATARGVVDGAAPEPALPPAIALMAGLMPLRSTGADQFLVAHPTYDGRGVLIAILDSGIDAAAAGLITTTTGAPKLLDLRDFSGEGRVALVAIAPSADGTITVGGQKLAGAGRIGRLASGGAAPWYTGLFRELPLGKPPAADVNGNGTNTDAFPLIVVRATDGWVVFLDSNLNGTFEDEMPLHDYRQGRETIALGAKPLTLAANFAEVQGAPILDLTFDTSGHGTHVAGIAAGHNLFNVAGFHGVAPGAQLIGLKIANNARGGVSVHGSMGRAMEYAARFAAQRNLPLVINLSFGVGNEREGHAVIDSLVNAFLTAHPSVVFTVAAGNDGPGLSTVGFPGSADLALSVGAVLPGPFARPPQRGVPPAADVLGPWSARGGELTKPDLAVPGVAFSAVPRWDTGEEIKLGTSMAAPHAAGLAACLVSAMAQEGRRVTAADVLQALRAAAKPFLGASPIDQGAGQPQLEAAYRWLVAGHQGSSYVVRTANGQAAAFRRAGLTGPGDTLELFRVRHAGGLRAAQYRLRADVPWLAAPDVVIADPRLTEIAVSWRAASLATPGVHIGTVAGFNPSDTLAGPLFTLVNTVVVPYDLGAKPLYDERRVIGPGRVQRYFLRASVPGATLTVTVSLPDSVGRQATVHLFEPNGQPFRGGAEAALGGEEPGTAVLLVRGDDLVPGVYELDVVAPALSATAVTVRAELAAVALAPIGRGDESDGALEAANAGLGPAGGRAAFALVGVERTFDVGGRGVPPETLDVALPAWAARAEIDVQMPVDQWDAFTDFAVTVFDADGQQMSQGPLNYAFGRQAFDVPAAGGATTRRVTVELFPAYARADRTPPWRATVRVRLLLADGRPIGGGGANPAFSVVPGGRSRIVLPEASGLELPPGFAPLVEVKVESAAGGAAALRRVAGRVRP